MFIQPSPASPGRYPELYCHDTWPESRQVLSTLACSPIICPLRLLRQRLRPVCLSHVNTVVNFAARSPVHDMTHISSTHPHSAPGTGYWVLGGQTCAQLCVSFVWCTQFQNLFPPLKFNERAAFTLISFSALEGPRGPF